MAELCNSFKGTFWPGLRWPEFDDLPERETVFVILPVVGYTDWGLGLPLDLEEVIAMEVLSQASETCHESAPHLILPPLRFTMAPTQNSFFGLSPELAHDAVREIVLSIKESGFRKVVLYNSSPWNEDLVDAAGRDLRIEFGMQMFSINLSGLNLDLLPGRSKTRHLCQKLGCYLLDREPTKIVENKKGLLGFVAGAEKDEIDQLKIDSMEVSGDDVLCVAVEKLVGLLNEVAAHTPLSIHGHVPENNQGGS